MNYSKFSLRKVKEKFKLETVEKVGIFSDVPELTASNLLVDILSYHQPIA